MNETLVFPAILAAVSVILSLALAAIGQASVAGSFDDVLRIVNAVVGRVGVVASRDSPNKATIRVSIRMPDEGHAKARWLLILESTDKAAAPTPMVLGARDNCVEVPVGLSRSTALRLRMSLVDLDTLEPVANTTTTIPEYGATEGRRLWATLKPLQLAISALSCLRRR